MSRVVPTRPRAVAAAAGLILIALSGVGLALRPPTPVAASDLDRLGLRVVEGAGGAGALALEGLSADRWRALEAALGSSADGPDWSRRVRILPEPPAGEWAASLPATGGRYAPRGGVALHAHERLANLGDDRVVLLQRPEGRDGRVDLRTVAVADLPG